MAINRSILISILVIIFLANSCSISSKSVSKPTPSPTYSPPDQQNREPIKTESSMSPIEEAGNADVTFVRAVQQPNGTWTFYVTVSHPDKGWEDYVDGWDVTKDDGTVLKPDPNSPFTRLLLHPHVDEQPFTRSQSGIVIPDDATIVWVRAHDSIDGFGGKTVEVDLSKTSGPGFKVER
jgi:hypothetical protein